MKYDENNKARILIVDDHAVVRHGIAMLLNNEPELLACCEAEDIPQALSASRSCQHDLAIVDLSLVGMSGLELVKRLRAEFPDLPILVMSMHDEAVYAEPALRAGAHGYLMKQAATETMLKAVRQILEGELYVSDKMRSQMLKTMQGGNAEVSPTSRLTPSEFEVLHLIGLGLGTSEISQKLNRSIKTIESHRANIKNKLNLKSGNELTHFAFNLIAAAAPTEPDAP
jgi:DNA-binding NarL/FixJ family response regulator